jgi:hypothetical protein
VYSVRPALAPTMRSPIPIWGNENCWVRGVLVLLVSLLVVSGMILDFINCAQIEIALK